MKVRFAVAPRALLSSEEDLSEMLACLEPGVFDGVWLSDVPSTPALDPLVGLAFACARTRRLRLGANIVPLGRNPYLLAKSLAQLDRMSRGRVLLSFVPGLAGRAQDAALTLSAASEDGAEGPVERLSFSSSSRGSALEELLSIVRSLWSGNLLVAQGPDQRGEEVTLGTTPLQQPLEVWLGGRGPRALERVGRIGDGWLGALVTPRESAAARHSIEQAASRAGREIDPEHFGMSIAYASSDEEPVPLGQLRAGRHDVDAAELFPVGRSGLRVMIESYIEAGLSKFVLRPTSSRPWSEELDWLADAVSDMQS